MTACLPCDLEEANSDAIVYRDDLISCEVAGDYAVPGWYVLRVRRHAEGWENTTEDEAAQFGRVARRLTDAIQQATGASGVYYMSFGENYRHLHFLLTARPADLPAEERGAAILGRRANEADLPAALRTAAAVRTALSEG